jgi:hypothetical protein
MLHAGSSYLGCEICARGHILRKCVFFVGGLGGSAAQENLGSMQNTESEKAPHHEMSTDMNMSMAPRVGFNSFPCGVAHRCVPAS